MVRAVINSLKSHRDYKNTIDFAKEEGALTEKIKNAKEMLKDGLALDKIAKYVGLKVSELKEII